MSINILLIGDSFVAEFDAHNNKSWNRLFDDKIYNITNIAQRGCSEYKILKQLQSVNIEDYDKIIIGHTSPNRVYFNGKIHDDEYANSDLIFTDVSNMRRESKIAQVAVDYSNIYIR